MLVNEMKGFHYRLMTRTAYMAVAAAFIAFPACAAPREYVSLNGEWQMTKVASLDAPIPEDGWKPFTVPGVIRGHDYERAWFRREFAVPAQWRSKRVLVRFGGVKYNSRVLVNGSNVGGCFNGYDAFEVDITRAVRFGGKNTIAVGVHDWTGIFDGEPVDFGAVKAQHALRDAPRDRILSPIGGRFELYGIWDDVQLCAVPPVHVRELAVKPSVRKSRLDVDVTVANKGTARYSGEVRAKIYEWDGAPRDAAGQWRVTGQAVATLSVRKIDVAPGTERVLGLTLDRPPLKLWWPHDPRLYILEVSLSGQEGDVLTERIGYRELWTDGPDFYLNGAKTHLLATSWWPAMPPLPREQVAQQIKAIKAMNATTFRTHTQPWPELWYELADEMGLMMIPEGAVWNDDECYRLDDRRFWDNYADHLCAMVRNLRNHPSVVMWSLENELYGSRARNNTPGEEGLVRMGRVVKQLDPTRPITFESDGDPGGIADVIGIHYPNEYPSVRLWPDAGWWLHQPRQLHNIFWEDEAFLWKRDKPIYIGEYLWVPSQTPASHTLFFGDEAYVDHRTYRTKAKAESWRMQILAYRSQEVSGQSPWTVYEQGALDESNPCYAAHRDMYRPLAAFFREFDSRFFSGETVERTVELFNDTFADQHGVELHWSLLLGDERLLGDRIALPDLVSGDHRKVNVKIPMPRVSERKRLTIRLTLERTGHELFREDYSISVFPRPTAPPGRSGISVFDPKNTLPPLDGEKALNNLEDWDGKSVLIIAPGALRCAAAEDVLAVIGSETPQADPLAKRVADGGRVLVLEQQADCDQLPVALSDQASTLAFPQMAGHPILRGISADDLRWWRGDHIVSSNEPLRPQIGAMKPLIVTGTSQGISHAPLLEIPQGRGVWLVCQMQVISKLDSEPLARILLDRMLEYLDNYSASPGGTLVLGSPELREKLGSLGLEFRHIDSLAAPLDGARLLVLEADGKTAAAHADKLRRFAESGGQIIWHRPRAEGFREAVKALGIAIDRQAYTGPALRAEGDDPLFDYLAREDLYWVGSQGDFPPWAPLPLAQDTAEAAFAQLLPDTGAPKIEAEQGAQTEAKQIGPNEGHLAYYGGGRASWQVSIAQPGKHMLAINGWGSPANDVYPIAAIYLDEKLIGQVCFGSLEPRTYGVPFIAEPGEHRLTIAFTNDEYRGPGNDRNLYIDWFRISPDTSEHTFSCLTIPPALMRVPIGSGALVLSAIRWDDYGRNTQKARRFFCSLLTGLGASFRSHSRVGVLEAERMQPEPGMKWFHRQSDHVQMNCTGYVEGRVRVERAGRYRARIWAKGTPATGTYPVVALEANGQVLGMVECASDDWFPHNAEVVLPAGIVDLRVRFTNDLCVRPEDRNLWIDRIEFEIIE